MEKYFNYITVIGGIAGGFFVRILGGWDLILWTLVLLICLDYVTGLIKAIMNRELSSAVGFKGIGKKVFIFIVIAAAYAVQELISGVIPLRETVLTFYIVNEALSLLENTAEYIPIPDKLRDALSQIKNKESGE